MTRSGCPSHVELLAYDDADLPPPRQAEIQVHVQQCHDCRIWLNESRTVGHGIRRIAPVVDHTAGLATLRERLAAMPPEPPPRPARTALRTVAGPLVALSLALLVTVGISAFTTSSVVEGGSAFARWLRAEPFIQRVTPDQEAGQILVAPTGVVEPTGLPFGLGLTSEEVRPGLVQRHYSAPNGLKLFVSAHRDAGPAFDIPIDPSRRSYVPLNEHLVLLDEGLDPGEITLMSWSDGDVLVVVIVLEQPQGNLNAVAAQEIVTALLKERIVVP